MYSGSIDIRQLLPSAFTISCMQNTGRPVPGDDEIYVSMLFSQTMHLVGVSAQVI